MHVSEIMMPEHVARFMAGWSNISLNGRALGLSLFLAVLAGIVSGFAPALQALRINLVEQLKAGSRAVIGSGRSHKLRNILAVAQISLAVALVIGASLMGKGMLAMLHMADRYRPAQTLIFNVHLPEKRYDTPAKLAAWQDESLSRLRALPGVEDAEIANALPNSDDAWLDGCQIENRPKSSGVSPSALRLPVSAGYFSAFQIPIIDGRGFSPGDDLRSTRVAIVSREFVARYFPGETPLGHRIRMVTGSPEETSWLTIVGVAEETNYSMWLKDRPPAVYMDAAQMPPTGMTFVMTTKGDPLAMAPAARKALAAIDPALPLDAVQTYAKFIHEKLTGMFYVATMLGVDALIALLLAAIGIFGVMTNLVVERTREIGVRLAMGARREDVLRMILRRATILTVTGLSVGLLLAVGLAHGVANLLYGVSPHDPAVFLGITAAIAAIALVSSLIPARRAATIDPIEALRDQ